MKTEEDIVRIRLSLVGEFEIDIDRIVEDPVWRTISSRYDLSIEVQWQQALEEYVAHYIIRERFLAKMPCTNGPGSLQTIQPMEVRYHGDHSNNPEPVNNPSASVATEGS
jgi:hypothetical protein